MKGSTLLLLVATGLFLTASAFASNPPSPNTSKFTDEKLRLIEDNLLLGFSSEIPGVQASAALTLKQLKDAVPGYSFSRSVIPLMRIVKDEGYDCRSRIAAGLALHALESARGDYAIKMTAVFTDVARVKHICEHLAFARAQDR